MWEVEWIRVIRPFLTLCPPDYVLKVCWVFTFETDYYCVCVECGGRAHVPWHVCRGPRTAVESSSLPPLHGLQGPNSDHQTCAAGALTYCAP